MPCFYPVTGYRSRTKNERGRYGVVFNIREGFHDRPVNVPCGQCRGCRLEKSRQWAVRCMHEASLHDQNSFITLTYHDDYLPELGSLDRKAFPDFMKRLRSRIAPAKVRYFHCGEYGDENLRPHYHALLFGWDFSDKTLWRMSGDNPTYRSAMLEELWPIGQSEIGSVTFKSAGYVARYAMKKQTGPIADEYYQGREPEYATMSRRPGIGAGWLERYGSDVYPSDQLVVNGVVTKPPRYYDGKYSELDPDSFDAIQDARKARRSIKDETPSRLSVREQCLEARLSLSKKRSVS